MANSNGWWNKIKIADINNDGADDIIALNHGLNSRFRCSLKQPVTLYASDFDENGTIEQVVCCYNGDKQYPMPLRHDLLSVLPSLKKKFLKYEDYSEKQVSDIFSEEQLKKSVKLNAYEMRSCILINSGNGSFNISYLPAEAQISPMYAVAIYDYNNDGNKDIIMGGNFYGVKPEVGIYDASRGLMLRGDGEGEFVSVDPKETGIDIMGEIRDIVPINNGRKGMVLVAMNNEPIKILTK